MKSNPFLYCMIITGLLITLAVPELRAQTEEGESVDAAAPADTTDTADATAAPAAEEAKEKGHFPRFRWGISGYGGPIVGGLKGGAGGMDLRLGVQIKDIIGVYAQPMFALGAGVSVDDNNASASGIAVAGAAVMAEVDFIDMIYIGLGPGLLAGSAASAAVSSTSTSASASTGPYFDISFRAGFAIGKTTPKKRSKFTIGLDMHTVFYGNGVAVMPMIALGYDRF